MNKILNILSVIVVLAIVVIIYKIFKPKNKTVYTPQNIGNFSSNDILKDCANLFDSMFIWGILEQVGFNDKIIISILIKYDRESFKELHTTYNKNYNKDLIKNLKANLSNSNYSKYVLPLL